MSVPLQDVGATFLTCFCTTGNYASFWTQRTIPSNWRPIAAIAARSPICCEVSEKLIEIYGVWAGNEAKAPSRVSQISLKQFLDDTFALGEQVFYRVTIEI